jgi:hypothetical protein
MDGVLSRAGPPNSSGYLNIRKKYKCPISIPTISIIPLTKRKTITITELLLLLFYYYIHTNMHSMPLRDGGNLNINAI